MIKNDGQSQIPFPDHPGTVAESAAFHESREWETHQPGAHPGVPGCSAGVRFAFVGAGLCFENAIGAATVNPICFLRYQHIIFGKEAWTAVMNRLKTVASRHLSPRGTRVLCALWLLAMTLPPMILCFYAYPATDDFVHTWAATMRYAQTGSLLETLKAAVEYTVHIYYNWQGTFAAMFLSAFQPMVFSMRLFFLTPLLTLIFLYLSVAYFTWELAVKTLRLSKTLALAFYTLTMTLLMVFLPGMRESVYWLSGIPYTVGAALVWLLAGLYLRLNRQETTKRGLWLIPTALCSVMAGACPYPLALGCVVASGCFVFWCFLR